MKKNIVRNVQKGKARHDLFQNKTVKRFWGNAARLEHRSVRSKKGKT